MDENDQPKVTTIHPAKGSLITFASGIENPHKVNKVTKGVRIAWSLWFTCNEAKRFKESRLRIDADDKSEL